MDSNLIDYILCTKVQVFNNQLHSLLVLTIFLVIINFIQRDSKVYKYTFIS